MVYFLVISAYMIFILSIGFLSRKNLKQPEDFYLGGRKIGPWVTALSFLSAYFSSVLIIGGGGFGYKYGLSTLWIGAANVLLGCCLLWIILGERTRKMTKKLNTMTIPDFLAERFNSPESRLFSAIIIILFMFAYNVSILKGMGHILEVLLNLPYIWGIILSSVAIMVYVSLGGYLAVVWTGFIQAIIMIWGLLLLTFATLNRVEGLSNLTLKLSEIDIGLVESPGIWGLGGLISFALIVSFGAWGMPQLLIRFYSIKSIGVLKLGTIAATIGGTIALLPYLNGAASRLLFPNLVNVDLAIPTLVKSVLSPWGGALFVSTVLAAGMSTFAAVLIISSSSLVRDILDKSLKIKLNNKKTILYNSLSSFVIGLISLLLAINPPGLVLTLTAFSWAVIASTCLWPVLLGLYWRRTTREGVIASMVGGSSASLIWMYLGSPFKIHGFIPGILVGLVLIIIVSMLTKPMKEAELKRFFI
ncbi:MAG: Osmoregulated proline transporter OpuE [candidate division WS2 bacterium]|uniref:Sodium/proline symporter n=1 Tax=Psychracetigena formicireducens TaxID=2986056 RepID=A0A9E2BFR3_PSYF1|nr:Osmoregulated proline transporter OpuE [Candidatus Psychracetigena formicireducens]MBT9144783.1 Osmoregulated proline transporter OpuE [Candidatus Psychracetigena formicireducens]